MKNHAKYYVQALRLCSLADLAVLLLFNRYSSEDSG